MLYRPKLYIASAFGFAVLILDSAASVLTIGLIRWTIREAGGDPAQLVSILPCWVR